MIHINAEPAKRTTLYFNNKNWDGQLVQRELVRRTPISLHEARKEHNYVFSPRLMYCTKAQY
jgi:hypothetical protein